MTSTRPKSKTTKTKNVTLHELLILKLQELYDVEQQLVKALPKMASAATDPDLKAGIEMHLKETKGQVERLEEAFALLEEKPKALPGETIRGLIADAELIIKNVKNSEALDAGLIAAAQAVEHYEMAGYGTGYAWARQMSHLEVADLLEATLEEEKTTDEKLIDLAISKINERANTMVEK